MENPCPDDEERWIKLEERAAEIIDFIQPNPSSEFLRNAVTDHLKQLIQKCFLSQVKVCSFGSVPLKTYLPDEDLDITVFSKNKNLKDTWANEVHDMLKMEERNENAEFHVKEVLFLQAEVKKIKCFVGNIVVNIYFNQLGGICRLCFLHEVDYLVNQNHLFKRSVLLIKAWCNYESCILGAHKGLISAYALEILVLYLFYDQHISSFGPLKVLQRFLDFYSKFDWNKFCISIWGKVPISLLPRVYEVVQNFGPFVCANTLIETTVETPTNTGVLRVTLDACYSRYAVYSGGRNRKGQTFRSNFFNVIDPLCFKSNLGSNVCEDNFIKICHAFTTGTTNLSRLLNCPNEYLVPEVNKFFVHTLDHHRRSVSGPKASLKHASEHHLIDEERDVLDIDSLSHWQNLQYGRTCPNPHERIRKSLKLKEGHIEIFDRGEAQESVLYKVSSSIKAVIRGVANLQDKCFKNGAAKRKGEKYTLSNWAAEIEEEEKRLNEGEKVKKKKKKKRGKSKLQEKLYSERRFSQKYRDWGVRRPSEEAKFLIRELIRAVAECHGKGQFHGGLKRLGNVVVKIKYKDNDNEEVRGVEVTLTSLKNESGGGMNFIQGSENDVSDLSSIIFDKILGGKEIEEYPKDIQDLHELLQHARGDGRYLNMIAGHTSLSNWRENLGYFSRIRAQIKPGSDKERKRKIENVLKKVNVCEEEGNERASGSRYSRKGSKKRSNGGEESWQSKVPPGPLLKMLKDEREGKYGNDVQQLIRFIRNVSEHLHEAKGRGKKYIDRGAEDEYEDMQYVEHRISEAFPLLLADLYKGFYYEGVDVLSL